MKYVIISNKCKYFHFIHIHNFHSVGKKFYKFSKIRISERRFRAFYKKTMLIKLFLSSKLMSRVSSIALPPRRKHNTI